MKIPSNTKKAIHCFFILAQSNDEDDFEEERKEQEMRKITQR